MHILQQVQILEEGRPAFPQKNLMDMTLVCFPFTSFFLSSCAGFPTIKAPNRKQQIMKQDWTLGCEGSEAGVLGPQAEGMTKYVGEYMREGGSTPGQRPV